MAKVEDGKVDHTHCILPRARVAAAVSCRKIVTVNRNESRCFATRRGAIVSGEIRIH